METKPHQCIVCCDGKFLQYTLIINRITLDITLTLTLTTYRALKFINRIWLQKVKYIISNLGTRCEAFRTKLSTHAYSKHTQTAVKRLQECIHGSHWAPGVSASLSGLPACLPACLSACLSICLFVCWDWHDSQSRKSRQDAEVSHAPWWNTPQPWGQHSSDSLPHDILLLFHLNGVTHRTLWGPFPSAVLIKYNLLMPRMYGSWGELTIHCSCGQMGMTFLHYS